MIEVIGRLFKYTRLDFAISPFDAISKECEKNVSERRGGNERDIKEDRATKHALLYFQLNCQRAW